MNVLFTYLGAVHHWVDFSLTELKSAQCLGNSLILGVNLGPKTLIWSLSLDSLVLFPESWSETPVTRLRTTPLSAQVEDPRSSQ